MRLGERLQRKQPCPRISNLGIVRLWVLGKTNKKSAQLGQPGKYQKRHWCWHFLFSLPSSKCRWDTWPRKRSIWRRNQLIHKFQGKHQVGTPETQKFPYLMWRASRKNWVFTVRPGPFFAGFTSFFTTTLKCRYYCSHITDENRRDYRFAEAQKIANWGCHVRG